MSRQDRGGRAPGASGGRPAREPSAGARARHGVQQPRAHLRSCSVLQRSNGVGPRRARACGAPRRHRDRRPRPGDDRLGRVRERRKRDARAEPRARPASRPRRSGGTGVPSPCRRSRRPSPPCQGEPIHRRGTRVLQRARLRAVSALPARVPCALRAERGTVDGRGRFGRSRAAHPPQLDDAAHRRAHRARTRARAPWGSGPVGSARRGLGAGRADGRAAPAGARGGRESRGGLDRRRARGDRGPDRRRIHARAGAKSRLADRRAGRLAPPRRPRRRAPARRGAALPTRARRWPRAGPRALERARLSVRSRARARRGRRRGLAPARAGGAPAARRPACGRTRRAPAPRAWRPRRAARTAALDAGESVRPDAP